MGFDQAETEAQVKSILSEVVGDSEWDDAAAAEWTKVAQSRIFELMKQDGYKVVVMVEAVSKGSGCVKQMYQLISKDDCVVQTQYTNSKGTMLYALAVATMYV
eukprot:Rhum_TRINITY_DN23997_c0_g1::Rhum_TRINITY_DN23997_c0_g1_i1::g.179088::m.179088